MKLASNQQTTQQTGRRWRIGPLGCLLIGVGAPAAFLAIGFAVILVWQARGDGQVDRELAAIRAAGQPVSAKDIESLYKIPEGREDITEAWLAALAHVDRQKYKNAADLQLVGGNPDEIPPPGKPWPQLAEAEAFLKEQQATTRSLLQAAKRDGATRFPLPIKRICTMHVPHLERLRDAVHLLALQAHVRAHRGDAAGSAESILAMKRLADTLEFEPLTYSMLTRIALISNSIYHFRDLAPHVEFSEEDLERLSADYDAVEFNDSLTSCLMSERVAGIEVFDDPRLLGDDLPPAAKLGRNGDLAFFLQATRRLIASARKPYPVAQAEFDAVEQELDANMASDLGHLRYGVTATMFPTCNLLLPVTTCRTETKAAVAIIAIQRYRRATGRLPDRLEQLVPDYMPALPVDPFDGQTFRYRVDDYGYTLYSVGHNGIDDGGHSNDFRLDAVFWGK